jgi:peptide/nickel transport system permease protein
MPGDYATIMAVQGADPESIEAMREKWGLNDPLYVQYFDYWYNLLQADVGTSHMWNTPVWELVKPRIINSAILVAPGITLGYLLGSAYGLIAGTNRDSWIEKHGIVPIMFLGSMPSFFLAIGMIVVFASTLNWFPTSGMISTSTVTAFEDAPWWRMYFTKDFAAHYVLPFATVTLRYIRTPALIMRTSVVEVAGQNFNYYKRITGLPKVARLLSMTRHSSLPVITLYPISMTRAIGGLILVEMVFNWPGVGYTLVRAVFGRDFPVLMFIFILIGTFVVFANFLVDIIYGIIDPRVQLGEKN